MDARPAKKEYTPAQKAAYAKRQAAARAARPAPKAKVSYYRTPKARSGLKGYGDYAQADPMAGLMSGLLTHGLPLVIKGLTGFGDYRVENNSFIPKLGGDPPIIRNTKSGGFVMRHREYIQDIVASNGFVNNVLPINPGLLSTFPLASQIADSFEQFEIRGMVMEYKSMSSDAVLSSGASSALGTVIFATQYNALDEPFEDKRTMENYEFATSTKPSCSMLHPIECKRSQTPIDLLYVRTGPVSTGDLRMYDLGNFNFAVQGCQNAADGQTLGELWISFELEFFKPKLLPLGGSSTLTDHYTLTGASLVAVGNPFYTQNGLVRQPGSNLGTYIQVGALAPYAANSIIFPPWVTDGLFKIDYYMVGTVATSNAPDMNVSTPVNCSTTSTKAQFWQGGGIGSKEIAPQAGDLNSTSYHFSQIVDITQTTPGVRSGLGFVLTGVMPSGTQRLDIVITLLNSSI